IAGPGRCFEDGLVAFRQLVPLREVDEHVVGGAALPPARIVVILDDLIEAELLVVIGPDPFGGVDGALLQRGIDIAASELLRDETKLAERFAGPTSDAHLEALEVAGLLDLLVEPATHLRSSITGDQAFGVELGAEFIDQLLPVAVIEPCVLLARIESEWRRTEQRPGWVLADVVILGTVAHFDGAILYRIEHLQARHDLAGSEHLDLEFPVSCLRYIFCEQLASAVQGVQRFRPACRQPPFQDWRRLRNRRSSNRGRGSAGTHRSQKLASFHLFPPSGHPDASSTALSANTSGRRLQCCEAGMRTRCK